MICLGLTIVALGSMLQTFGLTRDDAELPFNIDECSADNLDSGCSLGSSKSHRAASSSLMQSHRESRVIDHSQQALSEAGQQVLPSFVEVQHEIQGNSTKRVKKKPGSMARVLLSEMEGLIKSKGTIGLNPEEKTHVYEIEDLIDSDILPAIFEGHRETLRELQELYDAILDCQTEVSQGIEVTQTIERETTKYKEEHKECRQWEEVIWKKWKEVCNEWYEFKETIKEPTWPPEVEALPDAWLDWLKESSEYYCPLSEIVKEKKRDCDWVYKNYTHVHEECDTDQVEWEEHFCTLRTKVTQVCVTYDSCYDKAVERYRDRVEELKQIIEDRKEELEAVEKVKCLWESWEMSKDPCTVNETLVEVCYELPVNTTNITVIWPEIPEPLPCDIDAITPYPCQDEWEELWYNTLDLEKEIIDGIKENCHACLDDNGNTLPPVQEAAGALLSTSSGSQMLTCAAHDGTYASYQCGSQAHALERCHKEGLKLCSKDELADHIGDACAFMYTTSSKKTGYMVSSNKPSCGASTPAGELIEKSSTFNGAGMFNAACCLKH